MTHLRAKHKKNLRVESLESRRLLAASIGTILPIGDSITESFDAEGVIPNPGTGAFAAQYGIQYELFKQLVDAGLEGQFTGKAQSVLENGYRDCYFELARECTETEQQSINYGSRLHPGEFAVDNIAPNTGTIVGQYPDYPFYKDNDYLTEWSDFHFGIGGARVSDIVNVQNLAGYLNTNQSPNLQPSQLADIALIHLGTNGVETPVEKTDDLEEIVELLQSHNPNITVFVAQIIPRRNDKTQAAALNQQIASRNWSTPTSDVVIVDHFSSFVNPGGTIKQELFWDHLHPNNAGQKVMATNWFNAIFEWKLGEDAGDTVTDLVAHWSFDNVTGTTVPDDSPFGQSNVATLVGSASIDPSGLGNASLRIADDSARMTFPNSIDYDYADQTDLTVSLWFKAENTLVNQKQVLYEQGGSQRGLNIYLDRGRVYAGAWNRSASQSGWQGSWIDAAVTDGTWYHVAIGLSGGTTIAPEALTMWLDGTEVGKAEGSQLWNHANSNGVGQADAATRFHDSTPWDVDSWFSGLIDDIRVYQRRIDHIDAATLANGGLGGGYMGGGGGEGGEPEVTEGLVAHWTFDTVSGSNVPDESPFGQVNTGTLVGYALVDPEGLTGGALRVNDGSSFMDIPNSVDINSSIQADYTVALWFNADDLTLSRKQLLYEQGGSNRGLNIYLDGGRVYAGGWNRTSSQSGWQGSWIDAPIQEGTWHHVVIGLSAGETIEPSALTMYVDGVEVGTASGSQLWNHSGGNAAGKSNSTTRFHDSTTWAAANWFDGRIDDVRVYIRKITATDAATLAKDPNNQPPMGDINSELELVGHWSFDTDAGSTVPDISPFGSDNGGTLFGGTSIDPTGIGGGSLDFNNDAAKMTIDNSLDINLGTHTDLTLAFWFNADDLSTPHKQMLYDQGGSMRGLNVYLDGGRLYAGGWNRTAGQSGWQGSWIDAPVQEDTWHHVALTISGGLTIAPNVVSLWLDGILIGQAEGSQLWSHSGGVSLGSTTGSTQYHDSSPSNAASAFLGRIDDLRFYNRKLSDEDIQTLKYYSP